MCSKLSGILYKQPITKKFQTCSEQKTNLDELKMLLCPVTIKDIWSPSW